MENTMASSNVDDKLKKDTENKETGNKETNKILTFIKQNVRYITAGVLFLAMVLILVKVGSPKQPQNGQNVAATEVASEASDDAKQEFEVDAHEDVNTLINQYYTAYAAGDTDTLSTIAAPLSENEKSYISVFSQYVLVCIYILAEYMHTRISNATQNRGLMHLLILYPFMLK